MGPTLILISLFKYTHQQTIHTMYVFCFYMRKDLTALIKSFSHIITMVYQLVGTPQGITHPVVCASALTRFFSHIYLLYIEIYIS